MRKVILFILIFVLILSGCSRISPEPDPGSSGSGQTTSASDAGSTDPSENQGGSTSSGEEPSVPAEPKFYEERVLREGTTDLYEVPLHIDTEAEYYAMNKLGDQYLFIFYTSKSVPQGKEFTLEMYLYDMNYLSVSASAVTESFSYLPLVQVTGGRIVLFNVGSGELRIYNGDLTPYETYTVSEAVYNECYLSADCKTAYTFIWDDRIIATDLETMKSETFMDGLATPFTDDAGGKRELFTYIDPETRVYVPAALNFETEEIEKQPFDCDCLWLYRCGDTWLSSRSGDPECWVIGDETNVSTFRMVAYDQALLEPGRIMIEQESGRALYSYDGTPVGWIDKPIEKFHTDYLYDELFDGYFFIEGQSDGDGTLLFWSPESPKDLEPIPLEPYVGDAVPEGTAVSAELYELARQIGEKYGLEILIADQCQTQWPGFECSQMLDEEIIRSSLEEVDAALSRYPENFFPQLSFGHYPKTRIELVCDLHRSQDTLPGDTEDVNGYTGVDAFTSQFSGRFHLMSMNTGVGTPLTSDLYHEISHVVDQMLEWDAQRRPDALYSEAGWLDHCPEGFEYAYSYYYLPDEFYYDGFDDYFTDRYARTFPTEDRARILEYSMANPDFIAEYDGMREKLRYYSECIRDAFDTTGWPEYTQWEIPLELKENGTYGGEDYYDDAA